MFLEESRFFAVASTRRGIWSNKESRGPVGLPHIPQYFLRFYAEYFLRQEVSKYSCSFFGAIRRPQPKSERCTLYLHPHEKPLSKVSASDRPSLVRLTVLRFFESSSRTQFCTSLAPHPTIHPPTQECWHTILAILYGQSGLGVPYWSNSDFSSRFLGERKTDF